MGKIRDFGLLARGGSRGPPPINRRVIRRPKLVAGILNYRLIKTLVFFRVEQMSAKTPLIFDIFQTLSRTPNYRQNTFFSLMDSGLPPTDVLEDRENDLNIFGGPQPPSPGSSVFRVQKKYGVKIFFSKMSRISCTEFPGGSPKKSIFVRAGILCSKLTRFLKSPKNPVFGGGPFFAKICKFLVFLHFSKKNFQNFEISENWIFRVFQKTEKIGRVSARKTRVDDFSKKVEKNVKKVVQKRAFFFTFSGGFPEIPGPRKSGS